VTDQPAPGDDIPPPPPPPTPPDDHIPPPPPFCGSGQGAAGYPPPPPGQYGGTVWVNPAFGYAGFWRRVGARLLDTLLLSLIAAACFAPAFIVLTAGPSHTVSCSVDENGDVIFDDSGREPNTVCDEPTSGTILAAIGVGLVGAVPMVLVTIWYYRRLGRTGLSWGRSAAGIRLVDATTGLPAGAGKAFGRYLLSGLFAYALGLGYLWMLWDKRKQCWHDKVVNTVVVRDQSLG
jgi:uncharacterized RDD family membrane protein YckC